MKPIAKLRIDIKRILEKNWDMNKGRCQDLADAVLVMVIEDGWKSGQEHEKELKDLESHWVGLYSTDELKLIKENQKLQKEKENLAKLNEDNLRKHEKRVVYEETQQVNFLEEIKNLKRKVEFLEGIRVDYQNYEKLKKELEDYKRKVRGAIRTGKEHNFGDKMAGKYREQGKQIILQFIEAKMEEKR